MLPASTTTTHESDAPPHPNRDNVLSSYGLQMVMYAGFKRTVTEHPACVCVCVCPTSHTFELVPPNIPAPLAQKKSNSNTKQHPTQSMQSVPYRRNPCVCQTATSLKMVCIPFPIRLAEVNHPPTHAATHMPTDERTNNLE